MSIPPIALTIAGSDSGGGAGIQADLKTFSALGVYGCSVITALTAQNTKAVSAVGDVPPDFVEAQMDAVFSDLNVAAVKIGMLNNAATIAAVARGLDRYRPAHVVLDPVMIAKSGDALLRDEAIDALKSVLIARASLITPNLPEAARLLDEPVAGSLEEMCRAARRLHGLGARVVLKGGHLGAGDSTDVYFDGESEIRLVDERIATANTHGTGCTLSSAIAANLAHGLPMNEAVVLAKRYVGKAIRAADELDVGAGHGPVHHFHSLWRAL